MKKVLRSRILELLPYDLRVDIELLSKQRSISNGEKQDELRKLLEKYHVSDAIPLGSGTNRYAIKLQGYVIKIATDKDGKIDNLKEFKMAKVLYPYVTKIYEVSENGTFLVAEYIQPFSSFGEMTQYADKIRKILGELSSQYLIGDVGITGVNYANWGLRVGSDEPVCLDFAYVYEVSSSLFTCSNCHGAVLVPNKDYTTLSCPACKKQFSFSEIRRKIGNDMHRQEIGDLREVGYELQEASEEVELDPTKSTYLKSEFEETNESNSEDSDKEMEDMPAMNVYESTKHMNVSDWAKKMFQQTPEEPEYVAPVEIEEGEQPKKKVEHVPGTDTIDEEFLRGFSGLIDSSEEDTPMVSQISAPANFQSDPSTLLGSDAVNVIPVETADEEAGKEEAIEYVPGVEEPLPTPVEVQKEEPLPESKNPVQMSQVSLGKKDPGGTYRLSDRFESSLYKNVSDLARRIADYLLNHSIREKLGSHCADNMSADKFTRLLRSCIFKSFTDYLHFTREKIYDEENEKWRTHFNPPTDLTNPEYFDTMVFFDQYWRLSSIRRYEGKVPEDTMKMYANYYTRSHVHGINPNWLHNLDTSLKKEIFTLDQTGRKMIIDLVGQVWCAEPTGTVLPEGATIVEEPKEEIKEEPVTESVQEVPKEEPVEQVTTEELGETPYGPESTEELGETPYGPEAIPTTEELIDIIQNVPTVEVQEVLDYLKEHAEGEEEEEEDEEDSELSPVQVYLIKDTDYSCVKILGSDESGDITVPLYLDLDSMEPVESDQENTNAWAWLRFLCPDKAFISSNPEKWMQYNKTSIPYNNLRFIDIVEDHNEYLMGMYLFAGIYRVQYDQPAVEVTDPEELNTIMGKLSHLLSSPACAPFSHHATTVQNDEILCEEKEVEELVNVYYPNFDVTDAATAAATDVVEVDHSKDNELTWIEKGSVDTVEDNPYLAPVTEEEMKAFEARHTNTDLPVFRKEIVQNEEMFQSGSKDENQ